MSYVTAATKTTGDGLSAADWNAYVRDNQEALFAPPRCLVQHSAVQSVSNNTVTSVAFDLELADTDSMHSTTSNNSRIVANTEGLYVLTCAIEFAAASTGKRTLSIVLNGTQTLATQDIDAPATGVARMNLSTLYFMDENDYAEVRVNQTSGGPLNLSTSSDIPNFRVAWIGG